MPWPWLARLWLLLAAGAGAGASRSPDPSPVRGCCSGRHLTISLPAVEALPYFKFVANASSPFNFQGYVPIFIDAVAREMGMTYTFVDGIMDPFLTLNAVMNGTVDTTLVYSLDSKKANYNNYWGKVLGVDLAYTHPLIQSSMGALVYQRKSGADIWAFMSPLSIELWIAFAVGIFITAVLVTLLRTIWPGSDPYVDAPPCSLRAFSLALYESGAMFLGGEDWEHRMLTWPFRILRLATLIFALIFTATYTANLAACFTKPAVDVFGPKTMADLPNSVACTFMPEETQMPDGSRFFTPSLFRKYVKDVVSPDPMDGYDEALAFCDEQLRSGKADIWIDAYGTVHEYQLRDKNCEHLADKSSMTYAMLPALGNGFLVFSNSQWELAANISTAIVHFTEQTAYQQLVDESFLVRQSCSASVSDLTPVSFASLLGLLVVCGGIIVAAVLLALLARLLRCGGSAKPAAAQDQEQGAGPAG